MSKRQLPRGGRSPSKVALKPEAAIATIAIFSAAADNNVCDAETSAAVELLSGIGVAIYEDYSDDDLEALLLDVKTMFDQEGADAVLGSAIETLKDDDWGLLR